MILADKTGSGGTAVAVGAFAAPVAAQPVMSTQPTSKAGTTRRWATQVSDCMVQFPGTRSPHHRRHRAFGQQTKGTGMRPTSWRGAVAQKKEAGAPKGSRHGWVDQAATSCRASATSTESPSWFSTSNPDSGTSPDVLCETMIFRAISPRQVICEEAA